jgi:archaellum biogenesis protein FlaJ (TadC family)
MWQINLITGLFLALMGFLIIKFKMTYLIAGYNTSSKKEREKYDKDKLVNYIGKLLIMSSLILIVGSLILLIIPSYESTTFLISNILFTAFLITGIIYINVSGCVKKNEKKE